MNLVEATVDYSLEEAVKRRQEASAAYKDHIIYKALVYGMPLDEMLTPEIYMSAKAWRKLGSEHRQTAQWKQESGLQRFRK